MIAGEVEDLKISDKLATGNLEALRGHEVIVVKNKLLHLLRHLFCEDVLKENVRLNLDILQIYSQNFL